jgi:hypothetical protein
VYLWGLALLCMSESMCLQLLNRVTLPRKTAALATARRREVVFLNNFIIFS